MGADTLLVLHRSVCETTQKVKRASRIRESVVRYIGSLMRRRMQASPRPGAKGLINVKSIEGQLGGRWGRGSLCQSRWMIMSGSRNTSVN